MNVEVARLKSAYVNPESNSERKAAFLSALTEIANGSAGPKRDDAIFALRELEACTVSAQPKDPNKISFSGAADDELLLKLSDPRAVQEQLSTEAELFRSAFSGVPDFEAEPGYLGRLKILHRESRHALVRQRAFRGICHLAHFGNNIRASKPATAYLANFTVEQQIAESGGLGKLPDSVLLLHLREQAIDPTDPLAIEGARRYRLYPNSLFCRVLSPDYLTIEVPELGEARHGADMEFADELAFLYGCPERRQAVTAQ